MDWEASNSDTEDIPGSGWSMRGYILTHSCLQRENFGFSTEGTSISASPVP